MPVTTLIPSACSTFPSLEGKIAARTWEIGRELFAAIDLARPRWWRRAWWEERLMHWALADDEVKVQAFRFVDVLPALTDNTAILEHLREYLLPVSDKLFGAARRLFPLAVSNDVTGRALAAIARYGALTQARRFIAGTNVGEVLATALRERQQRRAFTLDLLGEAVTSETEAERYLQAYLAMLERLCPAVNAWAEAPQLDRDARGAIPRVNVSVKLSALDSQFDAIDPEGTTRRVAARLRELLRAAARGGAHVHIDMESYKTKALTLHIAQTVFNEPEFRDSPHFGVVIQCYLRDAESDLLMLRDWAARRGTPIWVRLVKGAYWDSETVQAGLLDWPVPVWTQKWESDLCYERMTRFVLQNGRHLRLALASHNVRSLAHGIAAAEALEIPPQDYELQMLYGMADSEKDALTARGLRLRIYMPFGELIPGMAYLVRRLLENTSNDSFLKAGFAEERPVEELLRDPAERRDEGRGARDEGRGKIQIPEYVVLSAEYKNNATLPPASSTTFQHLTTRDQAPGDSRPPLENSPLNAQRPIPNAQLSPMHPFRNEPTADFALSENRAQMQAALADARRHLDHHWPLVINGEEITTTNQLVCRNPSRWSEALGTVSSGEREHAQRAVAAAKAAQHSWHKLGWERRAELLRAVARELRLRRWKQAAWQVLECGKPWREADGDVAEAIDFCEYYALGAERLAGTQGVELPGEENRFIYIPHGVAAVIAPWNFPLAILCGMTVAALVTGNTVVMKPAEQSSLVAAQFQAVLEAAGIPPGVVNFLPGRGETAGAALVEHPDVGIIAFTGSRPVGLAINARAAELSRSGARHVKRVIAELGGKNAIIVDDDADLDEAVVGVLKSAFGYAGQKCSACSRCIVIGSAYEPFLTRLIEGTKSLTLGPADDPATVIGPVIDEESRRRILEYVEIGKHEGTLALADDPGPWKQLGSYVGAHIFTNVPPRGRLAQEEIFGPVLAVLHAANLDEALAIANDTDYALTGGCYSRSPANLERVCEEFQAGNLYLNRPCTGALVGRQPFGGYRMSGIGSKAGGPDYLYQFVLPRTITENTLRRGFAPEVEREVNDER